MAAIAATRIRVALAVIFLVLACVLLVLWLVGIRQWWSRQSTPHHWPTHVGFFMMGLGLVTIALTASTVHHTKVAECNADALCPWVAMLWCSTILFATLMISINIFLVPLVQLLRKRRNRAETTLATIFSMLCLLVLALPVSLTAYLRSQQTCVGAASEGRQMQTPPGTTSWHVRPAQQQEEPAQQQEEPEQQEGRQQIAFSPVAPVDMLRQRLEDINNPAFFGFIDDMVKKADPTEMAALMEEVRDETWIPFLLENCVTSTLSPPCVAVLGALAVLEPNADPSIWGHGRTLKDLTVALLETLDLLCNETAPYGQNTLRPLLLILKKCLQHVEEDDYEYMLGILEDMTTKAEKANKTTLLTVEKALKNYVTRGPKARQDQQGKTTKASHPDETSRF